MNKWRILALIIGIPFALNAPVAVAAKNIVYVLDASGSMWGQMHGRTKMEIAKDVLSDQIPSLSDTPLNVGLIVYGHRRKGDCNDIEVLVPLSPVNEAVMIQRIESIKPKGKTPILGSLKLATERLRVLEEEAHIILISDGKETCDLDPCAAVKQMKEAGIDFTLHVIGFDVNQEEKAQLQCLAKITGGKYGSVNSKSDLEGILQEILVEEVKVPLETVARPVKVQQNIEIVLDSSKSMTGKFEKRTRMAAAAESIALIMERDVAANENLAFRHYGGACQQPGNTKLLTPWGQNQAEKIRTASTRVRTEGDATLVDAVKGAIEDFSDPARFDQVTNRVAIFLGSTDICYSDPQGEIIRLLKTKSIQPDFRFIAMDVPQNQQAAIQGIAKAAGGQAFFVQNEKELSSVIEQIFEVEPVASSVDAMLTMLNTVVDHINNSNQKVRAKDYEGAQGEIDAAHQALARTRIPFRDLGKRGSREAFRQLYDLAAENREIQSKGVDNTERFIGHVKNQEIDQANALVNEMRDSVTRYNNNVAKMSNILQGL